MDNSWVKLYRKIGENDIMYDANAALVFLWLLIHVDKSTGIVTTGRFQIATSLRLNSNTVYKILQRLEKKYKIVTLNSNNKFTEISLLNWSKYQSVVEAVTQVGNNKVTTKEQQSNTKQEYRSKNISKDISTLWDFYIKNSSTKEKLTDGRATKIKARMKVFTIEEIQLAIEHCFKSKFHTGTNERGWKANADYVFRSDEVIDNLKNLEPKDQTKQNGFMTPEELKEKGLSW